MVPNVNNTFRKICSLPSSIFIFLFIFSFPPTSTFSQNTSENDKKIEIVINKNATSEELGTIQKKMAAQGFEFQYSNVAYNDSNEIVAITIEYTDANNNSGKYSVSSEKPINSIVIASAGNRISVKSEGSGNQASINQGNGNDTDERRMAMDERRKQMERKMEQRQNEMKLRRERMRAKMQQQRDSVSKAAQNNNSEIKGNFNVITKNTTEEELLELKKSYALKDISLTFSDLKRNDSNQITHVSITVDNGRGSVSTSNFGNGNLPIKSIQVMVNETHTILRNME